MITSIQTESAVNNTAQTEGTNNVPAEVNNNVVIYPRIEIVLESEHVSNDYLQKINNLLEWVNNHTDYISIYHFNLIRGHFNKIGAILNDSTYTDRSRYCNIESAIDDVYNVISNHVFFATDGIMLNKKGFLKLYGAITDYDYRNED